jgi:N6-L-threonylcarbamoyladenine synthase
MILGVESSCDDTSLAVFDEQRRLFPYEKTSSQINLHALYGGVVPQLAAREHLSNFPVMLEGDGNFEIIRIFTIISNQI